MAETSWEDAVAGSEPDPAEGDGEWIFDEEKPFPAEEEPDSWVAY